MAHWLGASFPSRYKMFPCFWWVSGKWNRPPSELILKAYFRFVLSNGCFLDTVYKPNHNSLFKCKITHANCCFDDFNKSKLYGKYNCLVLFQASNVTCTCKFPSSFLLWGSLMPSSDQMGNHICAFSLQTRYYNEKLDYTLEFKERNYNRNSLGRNFL